MTDILVYPVPARRWSDQAAFGIVIGGLVATAALLVLSPQIFITINPGYRGVLWSRFDGGTQNFVYGEGTQVIFPWDVMYLYDVRVLEMSAPTTVITNDDLEISVFVSTRFRPRIDRLPELQRRYGPDYARKIVYQEVAAAVQTAFATQNYQTIIAPANYERTTQLALAIAREHLAREPVAIESVRINRIVLPPELRKAVQDKLREQQIAELYLYRIVQAQREAERKIYEARGIRDFNTIVADSLNDQFLNWQGIQATIELAKSPNAKLVVIGRTDTGLPLLFDPQPPQLTPGARP